MIDSGQGWISTTNFVRIESNGHEDRLRIDCAVFFTEQTRKDILLRRSLAILAAEETRIWNLTDTEAIAELDALKAQQDAQFVKKVD